MCQIYLAAIIKHGIFIIRKVLEPLAKKLFLIICNISMPPPASRPGRGGGGGRGRFIFHLMCACQDSVSVVVQKK